MRIKGIFASILLLFACSTVQGAAVTLDFEGVGDLAAVQSFYNGGTDSVGNSGADYGISFGIGAVALIDSDASGTGQFANELSASTILMMAEESMVINVASGFNERFSFHYSSNARVSVEAFSGLDGSGDSVGLLSFGINYNDDQCGGDPTGLYCNWDFFSMSISGVARSIQFLGLSDELSPAGKVGLDNMIFGQNELSTVPLPASVFLFGSALLGVLGFRKLS